MKPLPTNFPPQARRLACAGCGTEFACTMDAGCWCAAEPVRMPMPSDAVDCLCPECLDEAAKAGGGS
ncbi:hypothetical protein NP284_25215 [Rhodopseudomonas pseudopalustris]|nr:cysteine-rich CWC family protein [Rhodopseudomonas pseudopalustris]